MSLEDKRKKELRLKTFKIGEHNVIYGEEKSEIRKAIEECFLKQQQIIDDSIKTFPKDLLK